MLLDLDDDNIRVRLSRLSGDRNRLTIDYPIDAQYRDKIKTALVDLLRPACSQHVQKPKEEAA